MRFPSSEVTIAHFMKSEVRIANKKGFHLHPLNEADGREKSDFHSFSQDSGALQILRYRHHNFPELKNIAKS